MPDYYARVKGKYSASLGWSFGVHINSAQDLATMLTTWSTAWHAAWIDGAHGLNLLYPPTTGITQYVVYVLDANFEALGAATANSADVGTSPNDSLPFQEALLVSLRSNSTKRAGRGRLFLPALNEDSVNANIVDAGDAARASVAVNAVKAAVQSDGSTFFVAKKGRPRATPPVPPGPKYPIVTWEISNKPARQSRRVRKVRPTYT